MILSISIRSLMDATHIQIPTSTSSAHRNSCAHVSPIISTSNFPGKSSCKLHEPETVRIFPPSFSHLHPYRHFSSPLHSLTPAQQHINLLTFVYLFSQCLFSLKFLANIDGGKPLDFKDSVKCPRKSCWLLADGLHNNPHPQPHSTQPL